MVAVALVAAAIYRGAPAAPVPAPTAAAAPALDSLPTAPGLLVDVTGAVAHPGLYRLPKGDRVFEALTAAGGLTSAADPAKLPDLAARLRDGQQVKVPALKTPAGAGAASSGGYVYLNSSSAADLVTVPGIDASLAAEIIRYRTEYGGFASTRELVTVLGMSAGDYIAARRYLRL
ncbi:MAG: helix-hairpin-helix domain-containing protein [Candidatus Dormibacteraeota bacterium]|nr:helix-hairpin-helix domain-containing protein [Candidatus Dormibacteraeota bacterium]